MLITNRHIVNCLKLSDTGGDTEILKWCEYVLSGLKVEIEKIDRLSEYSYLKKEILTPAIQYSLERKYITELEAKILRKVADKQVVQALDLKEIFQGKAAAEVSRQIKKLIDKKIIIPEREGSRKYLLRFDNSFLLRGIMKTLDEKGFLPIKNEVS